ncbi:hypothetical protein CANCADRAFT_19805, partial [Tortispora caseinolytica NRRL Y-17796]
MLAPPDLFGMVENSLYRCAVVEPVNFAFLNTLELKMILYFNPEKPSKHLTGFMQDNRIELGKFGLRPWRSIAEDWKVLRDDVIQDALSFILDASKYPILIIDSTCTFVGVLRKLQHWSYTSIVAEYRIMNGSKSHYWNELYLEMTQIDI